MKKSRRWERCHKNNKHHLTPRSRGGDSVESNLLHIDEERHIAFHFLFGNKTLREIIELLERLEKIKAAKKFRKVIQS